jgi:methylglutaconyl-CoA hydratase
MTNGLGRVTLNRPEKRNALTRDFLLQLNDAVEKMEADKSLRVLILSANGIVFCAGMDLSEMQQRAADPDSDQQYELDSIAYADLLSRLFGLKVPTIAVVGGPVFAGGVGLVLACDFIIASDAASFSLPEPRRGIVAAMVTPLLIYRIGIGAANQMLLSGEPMSGQRALQLGLCYDVVDADRLNSRVEQLVASLLASSSEALARTKQHITRCSSFDVSQSLQRSISFSAESRISDDAREGLAAFLEKRKPIWDTSQP